MRRTPHLLSTLLAACACLPACASAAPTARLHASFTPEQPGQRTTVDFRVQITPTTGLIPPPLTEANVRYPAGLDITLSGLGIDTCQAQTLEAKGPEGCPADSFIGDGNALAELQVGHEVVQEPTQIAIVRTPEQEGQLAMLFNIYGENPVLAETIFSGILLPASAPYAGQIKIHVPLVESFPDAPDVAVAEIHLVLGPKSLTYYERIHGKIVAYQPRGIRLPEHCPHGGFPFAVELGFLDDTHASAHTSVPCPGGESKATAGNRARPRYR